MTHELTNQASRRCLPRLVQHLDLFSGIGGFALAAQMVGGIKTAAFCEIDPWARQILAKNFPGTPIHDDVRTLKPNDYGRIDLITGGYPCQPFSLAGKRAGADDDRHLWPEVRRLVEGFRPRMLLCENVAGHVTMGLDAVLSDLEGIGYTGQPFIIPACAVDARHKRDRVWIMAYRKREGLEGYAGNGEDGNQPGRQHPEAGGSTGAGCVCQDVAYPNSKRCDCENQGSDEDGTQGKLGKGDEHRKSSRGSATDWQWITEPSVGRVADGVSSRVDRLRGLGNAIVPQVAAEILRAMMCVDSLTNA